jgi:hypothetical protein
MRKHYYNSLGEFYADISNALNNPIYKDTADKDKPGFRGLSLTQIKNSKYSYPIGVEKLSQFKDFKVEKDVTVKFYNQFDGYDIDIDRMMDGLDFLVDTHKKRLLPKTADVYINIGEGGNVDYEMLLCKTYAAITVIDKLEVLGVRCAVYACASFGTNTYPGKLSEEGYLEICIKSHSDTLNLGALCTAISPWMLRYWIFMFIIGKYPGIVEGIAFSLKMPSDITGIIIETTNCLTKESSNQFIESIKL